MLSPFARVGARMFVQGGLMAGLRGLRHDAALYGVRHRHDRRPVRLCGRCRGFSVTSFFGMFSVSLHVHACVTVFCAL